MGGSVGRVRGCIYRVEGVLPVGASSLIFARRTDRFEQTRTFSQRLQNVNVLCCAVLCKQ